MGLLRRRAARALGSVVALTVTSAVLAQSTTPAVFVTNNVGDSVTSFRVNPDGTLARVNVYASGDGPQTVSLSPDGRFLAVANGTASTTVEELNIFQVNPDATLTHRLSTTVPDSPLDVQWVSPTTIGVTQTGQGLVRTYSYNPVANSFTQLDIEGAGAFTSRLAAARGGSLLYANNTGAGASISAFAMQPNGTMQFIESEPTNGFAVDMGVTHDNRFLYGAGGISNGGNNILGYSIDANGGLTPLPPISYLSPGESPKVIALRGDDSILVAGHGTDATVQTFTVNPVTGDLVATGFSFDVGGQGTLGDLQTMGDLLFVTDSSTSSDGITGIYAFRINSNGSLTQLGPIQDTLGTRPEYIATWVGVPEPTGAAIALGAFGVIAMRRAKRR